MPNENETVTVQELLSEIKAARISLDRMEQVAVKLRSSVYKPPSNPAWRRLNDLHVDGKWWRCPMAREMLSLTNANGEKWGGAGMRDPSNVVMWIENMACGEEDEDSLQQGAFNFWATARVHFNSWKKRNGLLE